MRLDAAASRALNVLPQRLDGSSSFSLYGILARGRTALSKRLLKVWTHCTSKQLCVRPCLARAYQLHTLSSMYVFSQYPTVWMLVFVVHQSLAAAYA